MGKGVRNLEFPEIQTGGGGKSITKKVKKIIRRAREKDEGNSGLGVLSDAMVFTTLNNTQTTLLSIVQPPPISPTSNKAMVAGDIETSGQGPNARTALIWAVNAVRNNSIASYNGFSALRAEVMLAFLDSGSNPQSKRGGIFGGGVQGLLVISMLGNGSSGLGSIFGGGGIQQGGTVWGGLS